MFCSDQGIGGAFDDLDRKRHNSSWRASSIDAYTHSKSQCPRLIFFKVTKFIRDF